MYKRCLFKQTVLRIVTTRRHINTSHTVSPSQTVSIICTQKLSQLLTTTKFVQDVLQTLIYSLI